MLIALVILSVIATFTIPKVLQSQQDIRKKAAAKKVAAMINGTYLYLSNHFARLGSCLSTGKPLKS